MAPLPFERRRQNFSLPDEGPSLMIFVPDPAQLAGLPTTPQTEGPYVMWPGTPYAHLMVPVGPRPAQRLAGQ
jgi:hypothetical protein